MRSSRWTAASLRSDAPKDLDAEGATTIVDANGTAVAPGLIDSHVHPVSGDWTPRQNQLGWIDFDAARRRHHDDLGRARCISPAVRATLSGLKAMAIFAQRAFSQLSRQRRQAARRRAGDRAGHGGA